ncbi:xylulokinase [Streptomyces pactum]|uniref:Xylulokinase n=1 Tax=Streptomyces pactum TaxID=68249 RepID=A0ABS0NEA5_9ACTN|nr:xylulokinase [Streptomyces pactum]
MPAPDGPLVVGVHSATRATTVLLVDAPTGRVVARGRSGHALRERDGGTECDPEEWWRALTDALRHCEPWVRQAAAVSVAGPRHTVAVLDADGRPVRPALLGDRARAAARRDRLIEELGGPRAWAERTGSVPSPAFPVATWAWLAERAPSAVRAAAAVRLPHDHLTERLTGRGVTERGTASATGWWNAGTGAYDEEVLRRVGLPAGLLPPLVRRGEAVGTVRTLPGQPLPEGALVAAGTGDAMAAALGFGLRPGEPVVHLGGSGTVFAVSTRRPADATGAVAGLADARDAWLPLARTLNCGRAVERVAALLGRDREAVEPAGPVVVLPYLEGESIPDLPFASGLLCGLRHSTGAGQLLQAAYEGAVFSLLTAVSPVCGGPVAPDVPLLLAGAGARSAAWRETVRRLSGRAVRVPRAREPVALGAAARAAGLLLGEDPAAVARRWGGADGPWYDPVPRDEEALERIAAVLGGAGALLRPGGAARRTGSERAVHDVQSDVPVPGVREGPGHGPDHLEAE